MIKLTKTKIGLIFIVIILIIMNLTGMTYAADINPDDYDPGNPNLTDAEELIGIANPIVGMIKTVGIVIAVITMAIIGIKYMVASLEERAEYKKKMIPYLIGAFMVVAITQFLGVIIELVAGIG